MKAGFSYVFFACVSIFCLFGCQRLPQRPEGMPELVECNIVVTFGGEKIEGVAVLCQPKNKEDNNWPAGGKTDAQGKAVMKTAAYYDGVVPGEYTISFQKIKPEGMGPGRPLVPLKYSTNTSKKTIVVSKSQKEYVFILEGLEVDAKK